MKTIQSIDKAMLVLDYISQHHGQRTLTDISTALEMKITTLHGLLATLEHWNLITKNKNSGKYALGSRLFQLGKVYEAKLSVKDLLHPFLEQLAAAFGETVHLALPVNHSVLYIDKVEAKYPFRMTSMVGTTESLFNSAIGMVMLAYLPRELQDAVQKECLLEQRMLREQLARIRKDGYFVKYEENYDCDCHCVAICIHNQAHAITAGMSVIIPACRFTDEQAGQVIRFMIALSQEIHATLFPG